MKRVVIACILMVAMIGGGLLALYDLRQVHQTMTDSLDQILEYVDQDDLDAAYTKTVETAEYWTESENRLVHYIRRLTVDCVTDSMAKVSAMVRFGEIPLFRAELDLIRDQLEHMWDAELPLLRNLI